MRQWIWPLLFYATLASAATYYNQTTIPPTITTNTVLGNGTNATAVPQQLAVGTCSTTASALIWTTNTGFGCNTTINAGTLGGATFAAPGAIGGGTPGSGAFTALSATTFSFAAGTAFSGASWTTVSPVWNGLALTLNDTTASGTIATEAAYSIQAPTFTSTGGASTTLTSASALWIGTPLCTGGLVCTNLYSIFTTGSVRTGGAIIAGTTSITGATTSTGGNIILNNSGSTTTTVGAGSSSGTVTIGSASGPNTVNLAAGTLQVVGRMYSSSTIPVINAHFNTSSDTVTATSTAAFRVTVGTSTASNTGSLTFPAATTGWSCKVTDATTNASFIVEAFSTSTTAVTVNNYSRTTGLATNFTNSEKLDFICGGF